MKSNAILAAAVLVAASASASLAHAQAPVGGTQAAQVQLTTAQAVVIAENAAQGRATRVRLVERADPPYYKVKVESPGEAPLKLQISAADGQILALERGGDDD